MTKSYKMAAFSGRARASVSHSSLGEDIPCRGIVEAAESDHCLRFTLPTVSTLSSVP